jgi:hypothetical protein
MDGTGDSRAVHPVKPGEGGVRELVPQVNEGDDDPVSERQVMTRSRAGRAQAPVTTAPFQPGLLGRHPRASQARYERAEPARLQAREDTLG